MNVPTFDVSVVDDDDDDDDVVVVVVVLVVLVVGSSLVAPNRSTITERSDGILVDIFLVPRHGGDVKGGIHVLL